MRILYRTALPLALCLSPVVASAVELQPGVWEVSAHNMQVGGQAMPGMDQILAQLQNLPPEQRQMMEGMMAERGVKLGAGGVQICLTEEQIKSQDIPLQDPNSGCNQQITERSGNLWKFRFTCPDAQGEGETRFVSDKEFTTQVKGTYKGQPSSMESEARWVGADCAVLKRNG
ncbi:DUF3617 domain-containing protein [Ectopseudomonas mendocina]|uniref:DUF3617 domain-containing protein n=2 Tax=Ectopseudomonas mendocina TaxID=300 RepID=A0ABD7RXB7_ECTME|nr:DUF3617 domain-containing protein [Pseudomonas mendocina]ALN17121.1 hypothetical protein DW68_000365 [Pseudomonas mendocina S5.2]KES02069.1 hypothetical protein HN51_19985 [Pseudomonas mendocina]QTN47827.1 DUF3617 domain-containing protein [Pseudomonas mendocina]TRO13445.1 DUF3617 domain-containing protein [Pseudomonas mendocina]TRO18791.1 DUF3617 domain-containing protein [Pseudomonas mendocina]